MILCTVGSGARKTTAIRFYLHILLASCRPITTVTTKSWVFRMRHLPKLEWRNPASLQPGSDYQFQLQGCDIQLNKIQYNSRQYFARRLKICEFVSFLPTTSSSSSDAIFCGYSKLLHCLISLVKTMTAHLTNVLQLRGCEEVKLICDVEIILSS